MSLIAKTQDGSTSEVAPSAVAARRWQHSTGCSGIAAAFN